MRGANHPSGLANSAGIAGYIGAVPARKRQNGGGNRGYARYFSTSRAFSSEVETGSRQENASN
jgi:hypothetical protein